MSLSRKDFFRQGFFSLGEAACRLSGAWKPPAETEPEPEPDTETEFVPLDREGMTAVAGNERCLAGSCGCFACLERCERQAIHLVIGKGIRVDEASCTGCGACEYVCPVTPKAIRVLPRST